MAGQLRHYTWTVSGKGPFPFGMLPYDCCWPRDENAGLGQGCEWKASGNTEERWGSIPRERQIYMAGIRPPTKGRWESFGWCVDNVERPYMSYPLQKDLMFQNQELRDKLDVLKAGIKRFYVVWAPHLPESWREHFEELLGEVPFLGSASKNE